MEGGGHPGWAQGPPLPDGLAVGLLLILTLAFFWKLTFTNLVLSGLDVFTYFYPYRAYAAGVIRQGDLPVWNPYLFMGVPFLANIQTAVFYPVNWFLLWLPAPRAVGLTIVGHVFLAGLSAYAFGRAALGLRPFGALIAAITFAFSGFIGAQVEHVNQLSVSAWFPLLLLFFEKARRQRSLIWGLMAGGVLALQLLAGHLQAVYISLAGLVLYALFHPPQSRVTGHGSRVTGHEPRLMTHDPRLVTWWGLWGLGLLVLVVVIGVGLAAVQLLPTFELSRLSVRAGGLPFRQAVSFSLDPRLALLSLLPTYGEEVFSEYVAYAGVSALLLAFFAARQARSSPERAFALLLTLAGLFLALGGYNPVYWLLYKLVPGIGLFRAPARWLFLYTFGVSCLAGLGADRKSQVAGHKSQVTGRQSQQVAGRKSRVAGPHESPGAWGLRPETWVLIVAATLVLVSPLLRWPFPRTVAMWLAAGLLASALLYAGSRWQGWGSIVLRATLLGLLIGELFLAGRHLAYNAPTAPGAFTSLRPALLQLLADDDLYRILSLSDTTFDPGDLPEIRRMFEGQLSDQAVYDYVVATKQKEILAPNLPLLYRIQSVDGYDGGVLPLSRYVELQRLFLPPDQVAPDGRLREVLTGVPAARWLDLFNVKYVIADKVHDVWADGVYYDLGLTAAVGPGAPLALTDLPPFPTTSLGLVSYLEGAAGLADGTPVAEVVVTDGLGRRQAIILRVGQDTAEGLYDEGGGRHGQARLIRQWRPPSVPPKLGEEAGGAAGGDYLARTPLETTLWPARIEVRYLADQGQLLLRGVSLVNDRTGTFQPITVAPEGHMKLVHSGDVKIYENRSRLPRAFVVHQARVLTEDGLVLRAMADPSFAPAREVILSSPPFPSVQRGRKGEDAPLGEDEVTVRFYAPERIVVDVSMAEEGYLVLTDAYYPGWRAWVDRTEAVIQRADLFFRAVRVPAGTHQVIFSYEPWSLRLGATISLLTAMIVASVLSWHLAAHFFALS